MLAIDTISCKNPWGAPLEDGDYGHYAPINSIMSPYMYHPYYELPIEAQLVIVMRACSCKNPWGAPLEDPDQVHETIQTL